MKLLWLVCLVPALEVFKVNASLLSGDNESCGRRFLKENSTKTNDVLDYLKSSKRIVGGSESVQGSWPWQVALLRDGVQYCAGSLVDKNWIVTAAHCALFPINTVNTPEVWTAALGEHNLALNETFEEIKKIGQIIIHSNFDVGVENGSLIYVDNDVALFKLQSPATFNKFVRPICLLRDNMTFPPGKECHVIGWGHTKWLGTQPEALREVKMNIVSHEDCNKDESYKGHIHDVALCAGFPEGGVGSCQFDSGGPLCCDDDKGRFYLTGVVSWGFECARPHKYDVFANMMELTSWVRDTIKKLEQKE